MHRVHRWVLRYGAAVLCGSLGMFFGVGAFTFVYARGASYLSDDPAACINCHVMREHHEDWMKASHHIHATCNDCHIPHDNFANQYMVKASNGFWHSYYFTFDNFPEPIRIREGNRQVLEANCLRCHQNVVHHMLNEVAVHHVADLACLHCHRDVGHGPTR